MKVHITLSPEVLKNGILLQEVLERLATAAGLSGYNEARAKKHGIVTGEVDPSKLDAARKVVGVEAVEPEGPKYALR